MGGSEIGIIMFMVNYKLYGLGGAFPLSSHNWVQATGTATRLALAIVLLFVGFIMQVFKEWFSFQSTPAMALALVVPGCV